MAEGASNVAIIREEYHVPGELRRAERPALLVGAGALVVALVLGLLLGDLGQFFRSYLVGYTFWLLVGVGCLAILMLQHLTGGVWGGTVRRFAEAGAITLLPLAIGVIPVILGARALYPWTDPVYVEEHETVEAKAGYLDLRFWAVRLIIYLVIWCVLALILNAWSLRHDRTADPSYRERMTRASALGMLLFAVTITGASVDLIMSLEPDWFSTIFGALVAITGIIAAFALMIIMVARLTQRGPLADVVSADHLHDVGKLLLAFTILWTYIAFSQFEIIWSGNIAFEVEYYARRFQGGWQWIALALLVLQFVLPLLLLLSRELKRGATWLIRVSVLTLVMQFLYVFWLIKPAFTPDEKALTIHPLDVLLPVGIGGLWIAVFLWRLRSRPVLPLHILPERHPRAPHHYTPEFEHGTH
jgi:hypothetical protein